MKVDSKVFKGIAYVQVSELPQPQREIIAKTINPDLYIKLLIDGKVVSGCLQYKDYTRWYQDNYPLEGSVSREPAIAPGLSIKPNKV